MTTRNHQQGLILIVDDEPLNVDLLQQELEDRGYQIDTATNGEEALARVASRPPDLILLDVIMPVLDGIETCRRLKSDASTALIPVIIMTALTAVEDRIRGIRAGADDFLSKPVDDRELIARIETALKTKFAVDRTRRELASASDQLEALGRIDRDVTVMQVSAGTAERALLREKLSQGGGRELDSNGHMRWLFVDDDPVEHALTAVRAGLAVATSENVSVGIASGPAEVNLTRVDDEAGSHWVSGISGPAASQAESMAWLAGPSQVAVGPEASRRLEGHFELVPLPGGVGKLIESDSRPQSDDVGTNIMTLPWPDEYKLLEEPVRDAWQVTGPIYITRSLSGKSGARVYSVDITTNDFSGQAIMKLDAAPHPDWKEDEEGRRHMRATEINPRYAEQHLPRVVNSLIHEGHAATLSSIAGGGLEYVLPWAHLDFDRQISTAAKISDELLSQWNEGYELSEMIGPTDLLEGWLTYRIDPEVSRIPGFIETLDIDPEVDTFVLNGNWYPNPYAMARNAGELPGRTALRAASGVTHGDLHGFNVLIPSRTDGDEEQYFLIDLAFFEEDSYLFYDNAYFELAHLLHTRETAPVSRWMQLLASAQGASLSSGDDYGVLNVVQTMRTATQAWIDQREPNRLAYMESQLFLARVAVGLNLTHKRVSDQVRLLSLMYSAANLKEYLRFQGVDWPTSGPALAL